MEERRAVATAKRIVIKLGTSSLTHENGRLDLGRIEALVRQISDLHSGGKEVFVVSSGAVAAGMGRLGLSARPKTIPEKQALAAVGQGELMHVYSKLFAEYGQTVAQVLLSRDDALERSRMLNARTALLTLIGMGVIPIINENDVVAVDELKIGDNDSLSAMVASLVDADIVMILSDIDGLFTADPRKDPSAVLVHTVPEITEAIEASCGGAGSAQGTGGMATKLAAAKIATSSGIPMLIAHSREPGILQRLTAGELLGTLFIARENAHHFRKRWLSFGAKPLGSITVDQGCEKSLVAGGASLLPAGITAVDGAFAEGDAVRILSAKGREIARGLVNYGSEDLRKIMGLRTEDISPVLGGKPYDEAVHRDHLAVLV